ncbi:class I SAM-dependent methyltransferase [Microbacterium sp. A93]|uniref:class I SAM-dependent methyltransferase n=1 Tax=Microbacterium sp. A93 TaxID=3450716 RepID=UPI003F428874
MTTPSRPVRPRPAPPRPVPPRPAGDPRLDGTARRRLGAAFQAGGEHYHAVRPGYPEQIVDFMVPAGARTAVDLGAGTGLFTRLLAGRGLEVAAVDPSASMLEPLRRALPAVTAVQATAERTGLPAGAFDLAVSAQAWHWIDPEAGSAEAARLLRPGGTLALVWNQLDTTVPWVHRLTRIMHAGDVHAPGTHGEGRRRARAPFGAEQHCQVHWTDGTTPAGLHALMASRSYWLRSGTVIRARMTTNLDWYLFEHLGFAAGQPIELPYLTFAVRTRVD